MSQRELEDHRKKISFDVEVILHGYWQSNPPAEIKTAILADWADALEDWSHKQVVWALRKWRNDNPSRKPNPGHILGILKAERGKAEAARAASAPASEEPRERVTADKAQAILAEFGMDGGISPDYLAKRVSGEAAE